MRIRGVKYFQKNHGGRTMKLETLQKDMIAAMKAKDKETKDSISSLKFRLSL